MAGKLKTMSKEITITKTYDLAKPAEVVTMAGVLKTYIVKQGLYTNIKGKNYCQVDGWQFAGFLSGLNAMVDEPKDLSTDKEIKWSCSAKIYQGDRVVGSGYALCSSKEANKKGFDEFAVLSMAQTRAIGKAYRNKIGWIMKLAGYQSTPSEEMHKVNEVMREAPQASQTNPISQNPKPGEGIGDHMCAWRGCSKSISKAEADYSLKLFKRELCRDHQNESKKK